MEIRTLIAAGMLASYYLTAHLTGSVYAVAFIYGWSAFACLTPLFAFAAWYGKGRGWLRANPFQAVLLPMGRKRKRWLRLYWKTIRTVLFCTTKECLTTGFARIRIRWTNRW